MRATAAGRIVSSETRDRRRTRADTLGVLLTRSLAAVVLSFGPAVSAPRHQPFALTPAFTVTATAARPAADSVRHRIALNRVENEPRQPTLSSHARRRAETPPVPRAQLRDLDTCGRSALVAEGTSVLIAMSAGRAGDRSASRSSHRRMGSRWIRRDARACERKSGVSSP